MAKTKKQSKNKKSPARLLRFLNPSLPCFIALILIAANPFLMYFKQTIIVEKITIYAFLFLTIAVVWQLAEHMANRALNKLIALFSRRTKRNRKKKSRPYRKKSKKISVKVKPHRRKNGIPAKKQRIKKRK
jgi:hypothetical protein